MAIASSFPLLPHIPPKAIHPILPKGLNGPNGGWKGKGRRIDEGWMSEARREEGGGGTHPLHPPSFQFLKFVVVARRQRRREAARSSECTPIKEGEENNRGRKDGGDEDEE